MHDGLWDRVAVRGKRNLGVRVGVLLCNDALVNLMLLLEKHEIGSADAGEARRVNGLNNSLLLSVLPAFLVVAMLMLVAILTICNNTRKGSEKFLAMKLVLTVVLSGVC